MGSEQIILWLDELKYEALQRVLKEDGTDLEKVMQARLDAYYQEKVSAQERTKINEAIEAARMTEDAEQDAGRQFNVYRIREGEKTTCFESDLCLNEATVAKRLRAYMRQELSGVPGVAELYTPL